MKYIYGLNKSGKSIIRYLDRIKESYFCWDDNELIRNKLRKYNVKINLVKPENLNLTIISECYISPGISLNSEKLNAFKEKKIPLYRDLNLYSKVLQNINVIAVTGTNGKSTTTKLISDLLSENNTNNFIGGNIGIPLMDFTMIDRQLSYHVIELSSFQLESFKSFNPYISILLNLSPDHLDRYSDFHEYISKKKKIINLNKGGYNIVCIDDDETFKIFEKNKSEIIPISCQPLSSGVYFENNFIIDNYFTPNNVVSIELKSSSLFGSFNVENILAAYVVSKILNIKKSIFIKTIKIFKGLPHRLEKIYSNDNLQIINNSKSTNLNSALKSIENFENINLILGGRAKEKNFKKILNYKDNINKIYLVGEASILIFNQLNEEIHCEIFDNLEDIINKIFLDIKVKYEFQTILFSPACSSFDQFNNFEERGNYFKQLIKNIFYD